jgi:hypothetical protein
MMRMSFGDKVGTFCGDFFVGVVNVFLNAGQHYDGSKGMTDGELKKEWNSVVNKGGPKNASKKIGIGTELKNRGYDLPRKSD